MTYFPPAPRRSFGETPSPLKGRPAPVPSTAKKRSRPRKRIFKPLHTDFARALHWPEWTDSNRYADGPTAGDWPGWTAELRIELPDHAVAGVCDPGRTKGGDHAA